LSNPDKRAAFDDYGGSTGDGAGGGGAFLPLVPCFLQIP